MHHNTRGPSSICLNWCAYPFWYSE